VIGAIGVFEAAAELGLVELGVAFRAPNGGDIVGRRANHRVKSGLQQLVLVLLFILLRRLRTI
jgi:hypothetical protein